MTDASADYVSPDKINRLLAEGLDGTVTNWMGHNPFANMPYKGWPSGEVTICDDPSPADVQFEDNLADALDGIEQMMVARHKKYGAGNIAKHGELGIRVRMDDKFARLEAGLEDHNDETVENTLDDIIGYALIWKLWRRGHWPGSEKP